MDYYEINVALNGKHLFATAERSIRDRNKMEEMYKLFEQKFPKSEGYTLDVTLWENHGHIIIRDNKRFEA